MALTDYSIDTSGSPQDVQRKQALADALMKQGMDSSAAAGGKGGGWITALNRGLAGALGGYQAGAAQNEQRQGQDSFKQQLAAALGADGKVNPQAYLQAAGNAFANPAAIGAVGKVQDWQHQSEADAEHKREFGMNYGLQSKRLAHELDDTPKGFAKQEDGTYAPLPGGPQDPAYVARLAVETARAKGDVPTIIGSGSAVIVPNKAQEGPLFTNKPAGAVLDDQTVTDMADQYLAGDRTVLQNLGRGAQGAENIVKLRTAIMNRAREAGVDPKGIVNNFNEQAGALAGQRAVGTRAANISLAANEANNMIPIALEASDKLPRTQYMPWNQAVQAVQKGTSSPELASFVAATNSLVNSYVRAVSPSGVPTDSMRQHAYDMLNAAQGPEAYKSVVKTMQLEMKAALAAPSQVRQELRRGNEPEAAASSQAPAPAAATAGFKDGDVAHNPTTGESLIRKNGKWEPLS
jgi:hypothetical protein